MWDLATIIKMNQDAIRRYEERQAGKKALDEKKPVPTAKTKKVG